MYEELFRHISVDKMKYGCLGGLKYGFHCTYKSSAHVSWLVYIKHDYGCSDVLGYKTIS